MMTGKLDWWDESRHVKLTFHEKETGQRCSTTVPAGKYSKHFFYVILPRGHYYLHTTLSWPDTQYMASSKTPIVITGGKNAIYLGRLRMGVLRGVGNVVFRQPEFEPVLEEFRELNPSFDGDFVESDVIPLVVLDDSEL